MKVILKEPVIVSMGPDARITGWGPYQFPEIARREDGAFLYTFRDCRDSAADYNAPSPCRISFDDGKSWHQAPSGHFGQSVPVTCDNGDVIYFAGDSSSPEENYTFPKPLGQTSRGHTVYAIEDVPDIAKPTWILYRKKAGTEEFFPEEVTLNWPYMSVSCRQGVFIHPSPRGRLKKAPDGTLWMPHYAAAVRNPKNGGFIPFLANFTFCSKDNGHTWNLMHFLPHVPDTDKNPYAFSMEGPNENEIAFAPDGTLFRLVRTHGIAPHFGPLLYVRSTDGGITWSEPTEFADHGVYPTMVSLKCGVTVATYGRPGVTLRYTTDPACLKWETPIDIVCAEEVIDEDSGGKAVRATCGYTSMIVLDDHRVGLAYSYFNVRDEQNIPHKTMLYREIEFVEE